MNSVNGVLPSERSVNDGARGGASIADVLARDGVWVGTTVGVSMWPMLRNRRDTIVVRKPAAPLRAFDVALYVRASDGAYVLHRVIRHSGGMYTILGDNCTTLEHVADGQITGVLDEFWRGERHCSPRSPLWMAYAVAWLALWPVRCAVARAKHAAGRAWRKVRSGLQGE